MSNDNERRAKRRRLDTSSSSESDEPLDINLPANLSPFQKAWIMNDKSLLRVDSLAEAVKHKDIVHIKYIVNLNLIVDAVDSTGLTPLELAIDEKYLPGIKLLLAYRAKKLSRYQSIRSWRQWQSSLRSILSKEWALTEGLDVVKRQFLNEMNKSLRIWGGPNAEELTQEDLNNYSINQLTNSDCSDRDMAIILNKYAASNQREDEAILYSAIVNRNIEIVKYLLEMDADVSLTAAYTHGNYGGLTALDVAIELGLEDIIQLLLDHESCDVNATAESGLTPLHFAALTNNFKIAKKLISKNATIDVCSTYQSVRKPTIKIKVHSDMKRLNGVTALQVAAIANSLEMVKLLVDHGADVNAHCKNRGDGYSALHYAAMNNNSAMIEFLLSKGARVDIKSNNEKTILHFAIGTKDKDIVKRLLDAGADVNIKSNTNYFDGITPLLEAVRLNLKEIVSMLIEMGPDINATAERKLTSTCVNVIDMTLGELDPDMLQLMLNMGADVSNAEFRRYCFRYTDIFLKYLEKFRVSKLFDNERLTKWVEFKKIKDEDLRNERQAQVMKMGAEEIEDRYIRFYDLLLKNVDEMAMYTDNEIIKKALEPDVYGLSKDEKILTRNFKKEYKRYQMQKEVEKVLGSIIDLPYPCLKKILTYFSYDDLFENLGRPKRFKLARSIVPLRRESFIVRTAREMSRQRRRSMPFYRFPGIL
ncbi:putative ankyrin repeat protein RF_0381 [Microplitis demolitor]|uniref:putative ankyrin repeat protein RF_0381 n=1 Tax=Microplitis demolitor TaxID=69319 RepID=UPI0004CD9148|nr:putative ankyrin repeat protein RF_0381 [Microplitis demolitor]